MNEEEFEIFRHESVHSLADLNDGCARAFRTTTWPRWDYDLDAGTLVFSDRGVPKVIASIQVVGTTSKSSNTWLWSWANDNTLHLMILMAAAMSLSGERL